MYDLSIFSSIRFDFIFLLFLWIFVICSCGSGGGCNFSWCIIWLNWWCNDLALATLDSCWFDLSHWLTEVSILARSSFNLIVAKDYNALWYVGAAIFNGRENLGSKDLLPYYLPDTLSIPLLLMELLFQFVYLQIRLQLIDLLCYLDVFSLDSLQFHSPLDYVQTLRPQLWNFRNTLSFR